MAKTLKELGAKSVYFDVLGSTKSRYTLKLKKGWNLFSTPIIDSKVTPFTSYETKCQYLSPVWKYNNANNKYEKADSIANSRDGFWVRVSDDCTVAVSGNDTITQENRNSINEILQAVVKGVVSGNVSVKDSEKAIEQVEETITRLDEFLRMKDNLSQKRRSLQDKLGIFNIKDLEEKEEILAKTVDAKSHAESTMVTLEKEIEEATKRIPQLTYDIETKLGEILSSKITLTVQD